MLISRAKNIAFVFLLVALILCGERPVLGGTTGVLSGYVRDAETQKLYTNAVVSISTCRTSKCTAVESVSTDSHGHFAFISLIPDYYDVSARVPNTGIVSACGPRARVDADTATFVDLRMYDTTTAIFDCFWLNRVSSEPTTSVFSFDADGQLEH